MGKKLLDAFTGRGILDEFQTKSISTLVKKVLEEADDINAEMPSSSTGKYHPIADLGPGGNIRHSIMVFEIGKILIRSIPTFDDPLEKDIILAACLLHDICKFKTPKDSNTRIHTEFTHPLDGAILVKKVGESLKEEVPDSIKVSVQVAELISTHHSRWNTNEKYNPGVELPLPTTLSHRIVSFADLIAANKELPDLMFKFREEAIKEITNR